MVWLVGMNLLASWEGLEVSMVLSSISCFPQVVVTCDSKDSIQHHSSGDSGQEALGSSPVFTGVLERICR